ncbi:MAG: hypothetical protein KIT14_06905 [bacterium]|nr:hypothetical protein [bacterium]
MVDQESEDRRGLFRLESLDADGVGLVAMERPLAGARMGADERVEASAHLACEVVGQCGHPLRLREPSDGTVAGRRMGPRRLEHVAH